MDKNFLIILRLIFSKVSAGQGHSAVVSEESELLMFGKMDKCGGKTYISKMSRVRHHCLEPSRVDVLKDMLISW